MKVDFGEIFLAFGPSPLGWILEFEWKTILRTINF
jgi:hypothetical protein